EPYMTHPLLVTRQLVDMHMDMVCLQTGLLHDVFEDTSATLEEIRKEFGDEVARCVDGVTKLSKLDLASREERQAERGPEKPLPGGKETRAGLWGQGAP